MNKKRIILQSCLALIFALSFVFAVFGQSSSRVVRAKGDISADGVRPGDKFKVAITLDIDKGYHINAHTPTLDYLIATNVAFDPAPGFKFGEVKYPAPEQVKFEFSPDTPLAVHEGTVILVAEVETDKSLKPGDATLKATVTVQSCNDSQCLAPDDLKIEIPVKTLAAGQAVQQINADIFSKADMQTSAATNAGEAKSDLVQFGGGQKSDDLSNLIASRGLFFALISVFLAGLALNATPCVYPIIPITIGFFANQSASGGKPRLSRTFTMASMYVVGMAITYSILGVIASMTKGLFGAALQNPIVLIGLAALMVGLALSMFGVYEFRLPGFLNTFATRSTQSTNGIIGALVMGLTMGIVAAPCIGPFVLGLLLHVSTKGDPVYGFFMFFVLALGLGLPYLILGTFSGALNSLPRSGEWMVTVRKVFGLVLIGMALYFLMPLMGRYATYVFVAFFALSALYLIFWEPARTRPKQFAWVLRAIGVGAAVIAVVLAMPKQTEAGITWHPYSEQAIASAQAEGKGVIIDTFADWCIPCKELDNVTFTDGSVKDDAERFVTLKLDLTSSDSNPEAAAAKKRFDILGVPTVLFLDPQGKERRELRLEGFEKPDKFLSRMKQVESPSTDGTLARNTSGDKSVMTDAGANGAYEAAPALNLNLLDGGALDLASLRGKVVVLDFWATWCVPCLSEIPMFNQLQSEHKANGMELIGVSLDEGGAEVVKPFLKEHPMDYRQVIGDEKIAESLKIGDSSLPVAIIIDKQGRIRYRHVGVTKKEIFEANIKELLAE